MRHLSKLALVTLTAFGIPLLLSGNNQSLDVYATQSEWRADLQTPTTSVPETFLPVVMKNFPSWSNTCGDGRVDTIVDDFDSTSGTRFTADPTIPFPTPRLVTGCHGNALAIDYDLTNVAPTGSPNAGQSWIVLERSMPIANLSAFTHIRLAIRGSNLSSHETVEVKLRDGAGHLHAISLKSLADLPAWRPIYIDFRELSDSGELDLTNITDFEIGIVRCEGCEVFDNPGQPAPPEEHTGTLYLDEFALLDLKPGAVNRLVQPDFERVEPNRAVGVAAAAIVRSRISSANPGAGMVPAWFPEPNPNYDMYAQAEALQVFTYEYERTGSAAYRDAARNLARKLLSLQIPTGRINAGAWYTSYDQNLQPPHRPLPSLARCDGNETMIQDLDTCEWVGNVGWVLIALGKLQRSGLYDDPVTLSNALNRGAGWVIGQFGRNPAYPGVISHGIEGNISAYFGLLASGKKQEAAQLGNAVFQFGWDSVQRRMKPGVGPADAATAMDVSGSWGVIFLRSIGKIQEALDSQGYTATVLRTSSFFDGSILGYGDIAGPFAVAVEFTAQAAVAGIKDADFVMRQIYLLQIPDGAYAGAFPGGTDHWFGGALPSWVTTMSGVSPTAWVYFASSCIDPLWEAYQCKTYLPIIMK